MSSSNVALVPYDRNTYLRMHDLRFLQDPGDVAVGSESSNLSTTERLQKMLQTARQANDSEKCREPLESFLERLRQKQASFEDTRERETDVSLIEV